MVSASHVFRNPGGFTLVEVIIAAVILFSALAIGSVAHRASIRIIEKSAAVIAVSDALPSIVENIKAEIFDNKDSGTGRYGKDIVYSWSAAETKSSPDILGEFDESTGGMEFGRFRMAMKTVTAKLTCSLYGQARVFAYEYQELAWAPQNQMPHRALPKAASRALP
ncbi:MAG: hypothetical protein HY881_12140 [Deltaproteobacteria bacterium]|nr:hypothetical protein [Deltaproteobacteria bacterium]